MQDDENYDPQWSDEQLEAAELKAGAVTLTRHEIEVIRRTSRAVFEILEKAWASVNCSLIDMKIEFGVTESGSVRVPGRFTNPCLLEQMFNSLAVMKCTVTEQKVSATFSSSDRTESTICFGTRLHLFHQKRNKNVINCDWVNRSSKRQ